MASPFQIATLGNVAGLAYSPQCRAAILCDGSILVADDTSATVVTLHRITSPSGSSPTITALSQTFTYGSSTTALVADLLVINNGTTTSDVWLLMCSNAGAGATLVVAHGTFTASGASWSWDNTGTTAATATQVNSQTASIAWNGTDLIVVFRDLNVSYKIMATYTATKAGGSGWQTAFQLGTSSGGSSQTHEHPILLHDAALAGGSGATALVYSIDSGSGSSHSDQLSVLILLDSASTAAAANWKAEVKDTSTTGQGFGSAFISACVDPATGTVHVLFSSSAAGTGGVVGVSYKPVTVTSAGVASWGTRVTVDTTTGGGTIAICVDATSVLYAFYATGTVGTSGTISYRTMASGGSSWSSATATVGNTAGDGFPHVPSKDQAVSGYVPLMYQHGTSSFTAQYDNTISAGSAANPLTATCAGVGSTTATLAEAGALTGQGDGVGSAIATLTEAGALTVTAAGVGLTSSSTFTEAAALTSIAAGAGAGSYTIIGGGLTSIAPAAGSATAPLSQAGALTATSAGAGAASATAGAVDALTVTAAAVGATSSAALTSTGGALSSIAPGAGTATMMLASAAVLTSTGAGTGSASAAINNPNWGVQVSTKTQTGISGGPPGNNTTETDIFWTGNGANGHAVGMIPAYGGALIAPWYEIDAGVYSASQLSLTTSLPDGFFHVETQVGASFKASEDPTYTLAEVASSPQSTQARRYMDSGPMPKDANGVVWRVRTAVHPGEPMMLYTRVDMTNPGAGAISTGEVDYDYIAGMVQFLQNGVNAWQPANGVYGTVGGTQTSGWPTTAIAGNPDYTAINPQSGSGLSDGVVGVRKTSIASLPSAQGPVIQAIQNSNRMKFNIQTNGPVLAAGTTYSFFVLQVLRRGLNLATEPASIAADYLNPDAGSVVSVGTPASTFYSYDEGCYTLAAAGGTQIALTHTFPTNVTTRWLPHYKITGYTPTVAPTVSLNNVLLVPGLDYGLVQDTVNQVVYIAMLKPIVSSGAGAGQLNNGILQVQAPLALTSTMAGAGATIAGLSELQALVSTASGVGGAVAATMAQGAALTATAAGVGGASAAITEATTLIGTTAAGAGGASGALSSAATLTSTAAGAGSATSSLFETGRLTSTAAGVGSATAVLTISGGSNLSSTGAGVGGASSTLAEAATLSTVAAGAGAASAALTAAGATSSTAAAAGNAIATLSAAAALTAVSAGVGSASAAIGTGTVGSIGPGAGGATAVASQLALLTSIAASVGSATANIAGLGALTVIAAAQGNTSAQIGFGPTLSSTGAAVGSTSALLQLAYAGASIAAGAGGMTSVVLALALLSATSGGAGGMSATAGIEYGLLLGALSVLAQPRPIFVEGGVR